MRRNENVKWEKILGWQLQLIKKKIQERFARVTEN